MEKVIKLSDCVMVSDPCYSLDTWCQHVLANVLPGKYICKCDTAETESGEVVSSISVTHESVKDKRFDIMDLKVVSESVCTDSGTCGIFDYDYYKKYHTKDDVDDDWYELVGSITTKLCFNRNYIPIWETDDFYDYLNKILVIFEEHKDILKDINLIDLLYQTANSCMPKNNNERKNMALYSTIKRFGVEKGIKSTGEAINLDRLLNMTNTDSRYNALALAIIKENNRFEYFAIDNAAPLYISTNCASVIDKKGFVSTSGYGDGTYSCFVHINEDDKIDYIMVDFLGDIIDEDESE